MSGSSCIWKLGEAIVEEILKGRRLGARGFAWIRVPLQLGHSFEVISHPWAVILMDSSLWGLWGAYLLVFWSLEVRSEVATSDLEWRRVGVPESPCV